VAGALPDLTGADLTRASLAKADLSGARLRDANLAEVWLEGARLHGADLTGARGLETAHADWIDTGPDGTPEVLRGKHALSWLRDAVR